MNLDLSVGDVILGGRFKNKRIEVKSLGTDELGQPIVNKSRKLLAVRIEKLLPKKMQSFETQRREMEKKSSIDKLRQKIDADISRLYKTIYKPNFDKAEKAHTSGKGKGFGKHEWDYALSSVNKSKALRSIGKKYGVSINIRDTGPSEGSFKYDYKSKMNKTALLQGVYDSAFKDELEKIAVVTKEDMAAITHYLKNKDRPRSKEQIRNKARTKAKLAKKIQSISDQIAAKYAKER